MRGVGKTTLAAAYAERYRADYRATWWIRAQTESTMRADMAALGAPMFTGQVLIGTGSALAIREKVSGPDHSETATCLNNLALLLKTQGELAAARPLYERALAISEKVSGSEHPTTATSLNNLAILLEDQGDFAAARPLFERALAIREKISGPGHPETATCLNNLGFLLKRQGQLVAACPLFERALAISEKVFGLQHPSTKTVANNTANVLEEMDRSDEAKSLRAKYGV